jgi:Spy/CpxP family protein refolding chaperone
MLAMLDNDRFKSELGLTDEQAGRLRQLVLENEKSSVRTKAEVKVRQIELREMLRADNPNRDATLKKAQEISDLHGQMMKQHIEALLTAKTILTPEQQKKMHALMAEHAFRGRQPGEGRGPRFGHGPQGGRPPFHQGPQGSEGGFPSTPPEPPVQ